MNSADFFTMENIDKIPYNEFFSYRADDNSVWGFNIISFYTLFIKSDKEVLNPFTRVKIKPLFFNNVKHLVRLSKMFKTPVNITLNQNDEIVDYKKRVELKCLDIFQHMDQLGNYTDNKWFMSLNRSLLIKFLRSLIDIWEYRAQLDISVKKNICHPYGNPFRHIDLINYHNLSLLSLQKSILSVIEQFIKKGTTREFSNLGASYVLCALTLVNNDAANALPWLYESVSDIQ